MAVNENVNGGEECKQTWQTQNGRGISYLSIEKIYEHYKYEGKSERIRLRLRILKTRADGYPLTDR